MEGCACRRIFRALAPSTPALLVQLRPASKCWPYSPASLVVPVTLSRKQPRHLRAKEEKERVARVRATSAPSLPPFHSGRSVTEASPFFQIFFFLALTRLLSRTPRGLLSLGESPLGVLFKKAGFNSREKKLRGSGRIKGDGESLGCQVKGTVNNCGGFR